MLKLVCALLLVDLVSAGTFSVPIKKVDAQPDGRKWNQRGSQLQFEPLYDYSKVYVGDAHFGTPPQHFKVLFDTGSANTWVADDWCECYGSCKTFLCKLTCDPYCCTDRLSSTSSKDVTSSNSKVTPEVSSKNAGIPFISTAVDVCAKKNKFIHKSSTTYKPDGKPFALNYGQLTASGILGKDTFSLGEGGEGLIVPDVTFGQADTISDSFVRDPFDGIVGLAFQSDAVDGVLPPLNQAINDGYLDDPIFTIWLKNDNSDVSGAEAGRITFGDIDGDNCGFIMDYAQLTAEKQWQFNTAAATIGGQTFSDGFTTISDTGVSFIGLPQNLFNQAISASGATYDKKNKYYKVDCNANFDLSFKINELDYPLAVQKLIYTISSNNCQLLIFQTSNNDAQIVLGNPFNQEYCLVYDYSGQIGFAQSY